MKMMADVKRKRTLEHWVHWTLLVGVAASGTLLLVGLVIALGRHEVRPEGMPPKLSTLARAAVHGSGSGLIDLGLLVLMATPVVRVAVLAVGWTLARNRRFAAVALAVLALLVLSIAMGVG